MPKPLHTGRLVLAPQDPRLLPALPELLAERLERIGFIQGKLPGEPVRYRLGESFMGLVTFMGCSPSLRLEPGGGNEPFCYAAFQGPYEQPRLLVGTNTTPPRCTACGSRVSDWRPLLNRRTPLPCPRCGRPLAPLTLNWRHSAGGGRLFLYVENIFPREAIPSAELMHHLQEASAGHAWNHFYIQEA